MRVLHVAQPQDAGVPTVVAQLVRDQLEHGWQVAVATPPDGQLAEVLSGGSATVCPWTAERQPGIALGREVRALNRILTRIRPNLVHLHSAKAGMVGRLVVRGRLPTVYQPHAWSFEALQGPVATAARAWERAAGRWTALTLCVSEGERDTGQRIGIGHELVVIPNGVDLTTRQTCGESERRRARAELGLSPGPLVLSIGRLAHQKGHDLLIKATPILRTLIPEAEVVIVGDGPEASRLHALAGPGVTFVGHRSDVFPWLAACDVVALPSRWEAGSLVLLEALAVGRSVVATPVAGTEALRLGAGAVVPQEDPLALAEALAQRLRNPELAASEGACGRSHVERFHDLRKTTRSVREAYAALLGSPATYAGRCA